MKIRYLFLAPMVFFLLGCQSTHNDIIVWTGTTIGFDVSASPASGGTPQATLAYKRMEVAIVPSSNGITPDVLVQFNFDTDIFSTNGGICSRLAVGSNAVNSDAASQLMMKH